MFYSVPGDQWKQQPQPGIRFAVHNKKCVDTDGNPAGIKEEVRPLEIQHTDDAVRH